MSCYMIVQAELTDRDRFAHYATQTPKVVQAYGGSYICLGRGAQLLEGSFGEGRSVVISVWPSREAALSFWNSPEYAELKQLREGTGHFNVTLVDDLSAVISPQ